MKAFTLLVSLSLFLWTHTAQAAVLCTKKGGAVFLREACKGHETPLDPAALGIQPPAVYDANGKKIGEAAFGGGGVFFRFDQYVTALPVTPAGVFGRPETYLYWTSTDCSGTIYVEAQSLNALFPVTWIARPGQTLYFPDRQSTPQRITYFSVFSKEDPKQRDCIMVTGTLSEKLLVPAIPLVDLDTLFTPPFSVR